MRTHRRDPIFVEQIADIHDVDPDLRLVAIEEARKLLLNVQIELVDPRITYRIAAGNLALVRGQVLVVVDVVPERVFFSRVTEQHIATRRRDVQQVVGATVAIGVVVERIAVGTTAAALIHKTDLRCKIPEEIMLPPQRTQETVLNFVRGGCIDLFIRLEGCGVEQLRTQKWNWSDH